MSKFFCSKITILAVDDIYINFTYMLTLNAIELKCFEITLNRKEWPQPISHTAQSLLDCIDSLLRHVTYSMLLKCIEFLLALFCA